MISKDSQEVPVLASTGNGHIFLVLEATSDPGKVRNSFILNELEEEKLNKAPMLRLRKGFLPDGAEFMVYAGDNEFTIASAPESDTLLELMQ